MQYIGSLEAAEKKHISAEISKENSVKMLQICMDLQDSLKRSLQNPAKNSADLHRFAKIKNLGSYSSIEKIQKLYTGLM